MLIRVAVGRINKGCKGRFHLQLEPNPAKSEQSAERTSSGDTTADTGLQYPREALKSSECGPCRRWFCSAEFGPWTQVKKKVLLRLIQES